jgi:hypothetical protein
MTEPCSNYKSTLAETTLTVECMRFNSVKKVPVQLSIKIYELNYGPVLDYEIKCNVPYTHPMEWDDHPFMYCKQDDEQPKRYKSENIIDDTPAVRAIIQELVKKEPFQLYTTTDCSHRARLIAALETFWS